MCGRMPSDLVEKEPVLGSRLANIIAADDYADWLLAQQGTVDGHLDRMRLAKHTVDSVRPLVKTG